MARKLVKSADDFGRETLRRGLIEAGVKALKEYGYTDVNRENIVKSKVLAAFFDTMLEGTMGQSKRLDEVIASLRKELPTAKG